MTRRPLRVAFGALCALATVLLAASDAHEAPAPPKRPAPVDDGGIKLTERQIAAGNFAIREVTGGILTNALPYRAPSFPVVNALPGFRRLLGTVAVRKRLGDTVNEGEVLAIIESREVADAKSQYLAARIAFDLQETLFNRSKEPFQIKVSSENDYLRADRVRGHPHQVRCRATESFALGLTGDQIAAFAAATGRKPGLQGYALR
jgi:cobalt-zinc-cadmium efflux system membrane fusion protein